MNRSPWFSFSLHNICHGKNFAVGRYENRVSHERVWSESVKSEDSKFAKLLRIFCYNVEISLRLRVHDFFPPSKKPLSSFKVFILERTRGERRKGERVDFTAYHECVVSENHRPAITCCRLRQRSTVIEGDTFSDRNLDGIVINARSYSARRMRSELDKIKIKIDRTRGRFIFSRRIKNTI